MPGTNQVASATWQPQTDKFGNQVNPVWAQNGTGTPEQIAEYTKLIQDLATRALSSTGAGADAAAFNGYTLPNNQYVQQALQGWTPPATANIDPTTGRPTSTTQLSQADAFAKLGVTPGSTSVYGAPTSTSGSTGGSSINDGLYKPGSVFGTPQAPLGVGNQTQNVLAPGTPPNQVTLASFSNGTNTPMPGSTQANSNLSLISQTPGPGLIKGYDTNNGYKPVYVPKGKYVPGISLSPQPSNKITPDSLKNTTPVTVPNPTSTGALAVSDSNANIAANQTQADIKSNIDAINAAKAATETDTQKQAATLSTQLGSLLGQETGKAALTNQKTQELVDPLYQDLTTTNNQIEAIRAQQNALNTDLQGKPITMNSIIGAQAQTNAVLNAQILTLTAHANAVMNNISLAQTHVKQAVDAVYGPIEESISIKQAQLQAIQPQLSKDEKTQADAIAREYDAQKQRVDDLKTGINSAMSSAITQGINDPAVLNQILHATTGTQALAIVAQYTPDSSVKDLIAKYPDAGITVKDSITQAQAKLKNSKLYQTATRLAGGSGGGSGGGSLGKLSAQAQAIVDNPSLFNDLTPTARGKVINEISSAGYDTTNLGTKALSDTAITKIADLQTGLAGLQELKTTIQNNTDKLGPITGLSALNPWSESKKIQANINLIKQKVGKALEGGVLRKEDEEKYKQILATLTDTPETAVYKTDALITSLQRDIDTYTSLQQSGGRSTNVNAPLTKKGAVSDVSELQKKYNY